MDALPLEWRLGNAAVSYVRYLGKFVWPMNLAAFYPFPMDGPDTLAVVASCMFLAAVTWWVFRSRARRPWLLAGWGWYLVTLLPVIGIVQVGMQSMADRYLYVPMIGLLLALGWCFTPSRERERPVGRARTTVRLRSRIRMGIAVIVAVLAFWGVLTWLQVHYWRDGVTLFTHTIEVTDDNFVAHDNLGVELDRQGRHDEALAEYRETLRIRPSDRNGATNFAQASFAKGERLFQQSKMDDALSAFQDGLRYRTDSAPAHLYVAQILASQGRAPAAEAEFRVAIAQDPLSEAAHMGLGAVLAREGRLDEAASELRKAPSLADAQFNLGLVERARGHRAESLAALDEAVRLGSEVARAVRAQVAKEAVK
jgi:Flp pilus assembly protein TadD